MGKSMGTVDKAFHLLSFFTVSEPEWGLSDLARRAGQDKSTALRLLNSLMASGFVEQDPTTRTFRIGTAVLKLARIREASFPFVALARPPAERLSVSIGETIHVCLPEADALATVHIVEPQRATRVYVDPSQPLPYHATASGLAFLAFARSDFVDTALSSIEFRAHTEHTITSRQALTDKLASIRSGAYAVSSSSFELETIGIASPIFDASGYAMGTLAAACLASRMTPELELRIASAVTGTAIEISRALGAEPPAVFIQSYLDLAA